jgi:hypothetical protein
LTSSQQAHKGPPSQQLPIVAEIYPKTPSR